MAKDACSSCGNTVQRTKSSRPEIICHECRWELRQIREAELSAKRRGNAEARWAAMRKPCGTNAAYSRHLRKGETPCDACIEAAREARKNRVPSGGKIDQCSQCGKTVRRHRTSAPEIICQECRRSEPAGKYRDAVCEQCGCDFQSQRNGQSPTGWTRYCSRTCVGLARRKTPDGYERHRWASMSEEARQRKRQRARQRHRAHQLTYDGVSDEQILERDGWRCRMDACLYRSRRINPEYKYPDKRSASIDHIVPLSVSQDDTSFNKRAAHLGCNMARGAGRPGEQMALDFTTAAPVTRERRKRVSRPRPPRPCRTCGELVKGKCDLHEPVRYANCKRCDAPVIKRGPMICQACTACAADGCTARGGFGKGYCAAHYHRLNRYGDVFSDIPLAQDRLSRLEVAQLIRLRLAQDGDRLQDGVAA